MTLQEAYKKITSSPELKAKALEALKSGKGDEFLKEQGIDYSLDQIKEFLQPKESGELSREQLDMAAGGCLVLDGVAMRTLDFIGDPECVALLNPPESKN